MPAFLTISVGPNASEAKVVLASADQGAVAAALDALWNRIIRDEAQAGHRRIVSEARRAAEN